MKHIALSLMILTYIMAFVHWSSLFVKQDVDLATLYTTKTVFWFLVFRFGFGDNNNE
jgi:hypothetical protein